MDLNTQICILENCKKMMEISQSRGCWKVTEIKDIGITYNNLCKLLEEIEEKINPPKVEDISENIEDNSTDNVELKVI